MHAERSSGMISSHRGGEGAAPPVRATFNDWETAKMSPTPVLLPENPSAHVAVNGERGGYRREAWNRYRAAAHRFACEPEDPAAAVELEQAADGLRRMAAIAAWRRG